MRVVLAGWFIYAVLLTGCGGTEDPDFDGPEWEGECPTVEQLKKERHDNIYNNPNGWPLPDYETYCPEVWAASSK